ncbi:MAG: phosphotransferase, partial [Sciscionella sp.]
VPEGERRIVHGDFRPGNLSYGAQGRVLAVFDWELATLGDPLADLAWLLSSWQRPGDTEPPVTPGPSMAKGFAERDDLIQAYATATGRDLRELDYYLAFSRWRSACIGAGVAARYQAGVMGDRDGSDRAADARTAAVTAQIHAAARMLGLR